MSKFKVGDEVRCLRGSNSSELEKGRVYTVYKIGSSWGSLYLTEFRQEGWNYDPELFELAEDRSNYHKHHDVICAWAKGAEVESRGRTRGWQITETPVWLEHKEYRIKPAPARTTTDIEMERIETEMRKLADQLSDLKGEK